jgi:hypothetical protein
VLSVRIPSAGDREFRRQVMLRFHNVTADCAIAAANVVVIRRVPSELALDLMILDWPDASRIWIQTSSFESSTHSREGPRLAPRGNFRKRGSTVIRSMHKNRGHVSGFHGVEKRVLYGEL